MTHWKKVLLPAVCAGLAAAIPVTSFAASKITSVTIELDSAITVGDSDSEVDGSTDSDKYYVDTVKWRMSRKTTGRKAISPNSKSLWRLRTIIFLTPDFPKRK